MAAVDDLEEPLLLTAQKAYPKCPGCKVAHLSCDGASRPYKELSLVAVMMLANALPISFMYPFLYFMVATLSGSFLLINNSVAPRNRGRANGLSTSAVSFFKAVGPGAGGAIFSWAQSRVSNILPGNQMVFFILGLVALLDVIFTFEPFLPYTVNKPLHDEDRVPIKYSSSTAK